MGIHLYTYPHIYKVREKKKHSWHKGVTLINGCCISLCVQVYNISLSCTHISFLSCVYLVNSSLSAEAKYATPVANEKDL